MIDRGSGPPVVLLPGIQGRWEWMAPALRKLAAHCRVISYSLGGDIGSGRRAAGFDGYVNQLDEVLDVAGVERAAICGVSFGGFIAVRYAATRDPRVGALVLASAPAPGWRPNHQQERWVQSPWRSAPTFVATAPFRLWPEVSAAYPDARSRLQFFVRTGIRAASAPMIPGLMGKRVREALSLDFTEDCRKVAAPTLVISGEPELDRVVPVANTRRYASLIPNARYELMPGTGHLGVLTHPDRFAAIVSGFIHGHDF
jgi:pimeloyl-ACP methyl ester carboxylesterase